jgi:tetratricopeptide (TPR) repeat protein
MSRGPAFVVGLILGGLTVGSAHADPGSAVAKESPADLLRRAEEAHTKGRWADAVALWDKVIKTNPVRADHWQRLGRACYNHKDYRAAIPALAKAVELGAGYPANSAYDIACCHALLGQKDQALAWLDKALKLGYRDLARARTDSDLKSLRDDPKYQDLVAAADVKAMTRDEGWRYDLRLLAREIKRMHFNPFRQVTREQFDAYVRRLHDDIPKLSDAQVTVGLMKLARMAGDGHTHVAPSPRPKTTPLQPYLFEEGLFVTAAAPDHADLAGAQILEVAGRPVPSLLADLGAVISQDNAMGVKARAPRLLTAPLILHGLGLCPSADELTYKVRDISGKERTVTLQATAAEPDPKWPTARREASGPEPLYLKNRKAAYWFEHLPEARTVYCQYNAVRNDGKETLAAFCDRLFKFVNEKDVDRLVLDLRWNGGGNSFLNRPLVHGVVRCDKINRPGKLFVVVGRQTFSAAQNCTTDLEMHTNALFVGEPSGASPNFIGESVRISLPYSKMTGTISDLHWVRSWPMDYRTWVAPHLYAPPTFAAYRANRDPALEAILAYKPPADQTAPPAR